MNRKILLGCVATIALAAAAPLASAQDSSSSYNERPNASSSQDPSSYGGRSSGQDMQGSYGDRNGSNGQQDESSSYNSSRMHGQSAQGSSSYGSSRTSERDAPSYASDTDTGGKKTMACSVSETAKAKSMHLTCTQMQARISHQSTSHHKRVAKNTHTSHKTARASTSMKTAYSGGHYSRSMAQGQMSSQYGQYGQNESRTGQSYGQSQMGQGYGSSQGSMGQSQYGMSGGAQFSEREQGSSSMSGQSRYGSDNDRYASRGESGYGRGQYEESSAGPRHLNPEDFVALRTVDPDRLNGVSVKTMSGMTVGHVTNISLGPNGTPSEVEIALNNGREVRVGASTLRYNPSSHILLSNIDQGELQAMAGGGREDRDQYDDSRNYH